MSPVASDTLAGVLDHVTVTRYVTPLREGGSLPALVEADNLGTYVMKFRGAGQGPLALVAEIIAGELARRLGLRVPDLVLADLDPRIPGSEPDPEIQDLLRASEGLNLAVDFLPGSVGFDPLGWTADPDHRPARPRAQRPHHRSRRRARPLVRHPGPHPLTPRASRAAAGKLRTSPPRPIASGPPWCPAPAPSRPGRPARSAPRRCPGPPLPRRTPADRPRTRRAARGRRADPARE